MSRQGRGQSWGCLRRPRRSLPRSCLSLQPRLPLMRLHSSRGSRLLPSRILTPSHSQSSLQRPHCLPLMRLGQTLLARRPRHQRLLARHRPHSLILALRPRRRPISLRHRPHSLILVLRLPLCRSAHHSSQPSQDSKRHPLGRLSLKRSPNLGRRRARRLSRQRPRLPRQGRRLLGWLPVNHAASRRKPTKRFA
jgi:hypothetical protein